MTAPTWASVVAAVPHDEGCAVTQFEPTGTLPQQAPLCRCTRDARIGSGIAAVRESDNYHRQVGERACTCGRYVLSDFYDSGEVHDFAEHRDAVAVAAFVAASKPKEATDDR